MRRSNVVATGLALLLAVVGCQTTGAQDGGPAEQPPATKTTAPEVGQVEVAYVNTLRWTTASEVDNFGFDVYRSLDEEGPFDRITETPIAGAGTVDEPQSYVYVDDTIDPAKGYYYFIESISIDGIREKFSPVSYVKPKKPVATEPTPAAEAEAADAGES